MPQIKSKTYSDDMENPPARFEQHKIFKHFTSRGYGREYIQRICLWDVLSTSRIWESEFYCKNFLYSSCLTFNQGIPVIPRPPIAVEGRQVRNDVCIHLVFDTTQPCCKDIHSILLLLQYNNKNQSAHIYSIYHIDRNCSLLFVSEKHFCLVHRITALLWHPDMSDMLRKI